MKVIFIFLLVIIVIATNVLWYAIKSILSDHGYKVNFLYGHFKDLFNFRDLILKTEDKKTKSKYNKMFWSLMLLLFIFFASAFLTFNGNFI